MNLVTIGTYQTLGGARGAQCVWFEKEKKQTSVFALCWWLDHLADQNHPYYDTAIALPQRWPERIPSPL
jgi:hypothetical protein